MKSAMISIFRSLKSTIVDRFSNRAFSQRLKLGRLTAICAVLAVVAGGTWNSAAAQNGFVGAQRVLGSGFSNAYGIKGVAVDVGGNVFVADPGNNAVKEVLAASGYTTVNTLGSGFYQPLGVAVDKNGNVFVADTANYAVKEILAAGSYSTVKILASGFADPEGIAVDGSGNVYVADGSGNAVKEILAVGGSIPVSPTIRTLGSGFSNPTGVAVDGTGSVFVADQNNNLVKEILAVNGSVPASPAINTLATAHGIFSGPAGIAVDGNGNVWVAEASGFDLKEILAAGGYATVVTPVTGLHYPVGVVVDGSGNAYAANSGTLYQYQWGSVNFGSQAVGSTSSTVQMNFTIPAGAQVGSFALTTLGNKNTEFADAGGSTCTIGTYSSNTNCVYNVKFTPQAPGLRRGALTAFDSTGTLLAFWRIYGTGTGPQVAFNAAKTALTGTVSPNMTNAMRVQADAQGNLYAAIWGDAANDPNTGSVVVFQKNGASYNAGVTLANGLSQPVDLAIDGAGNVLVLSLADGNNDANTGSVQIILKSILGWASSPTTVESGLNSPWGMAVDAKEDLFVSLSKSGQVIEYPISGSGSGFDAPVTLASGLVSPMGLALDGSGNLFIALYRDANKDPNSGSVVALPVSASGYGSPVTVATGLSYPAGLAVDTNDNVLVASVMDSSLAVSTGSILEVPFTGSGFGSPVTLASGMTFPQGVALDSSGNIFFPDQGTNQLYELPRTTAAPRTFATTVDGSLSTDSPQTVKVYNIGNQPLAFTSVAFPSDFPEDSSGTADCSSSNPLAANGMCTLTVDFRPGTVGSLSESLVLTDNALNAAGPNYTTQTIALSGTSTGAKTTPAITWATPAPIVYGTPLGTAQLNASTTVAGSFSFNPAAGTVLSAGNQILSATFTPTDTAAYNPVTTTVVLVVTKAALAVTASNQSMTYGGTVPTLAGTLTGVVSGDGITATYATTAGANPAVGTYPITATLADPGSKLGNYVVTNTSGTLTVGKAALAVTATNQSMTYGGTVPTLTGTITGVVSGDGITATYATTASSSPAAGSYPITVTLNDPNSKLGNYTVTNTAGTLTVAKAALAVTATSQSMTYGGAVPTLTGTLTGVVSGDGITATYATTATSASTAGSYAITATLNDPNSKLGNYTVTNTAGTLTIGKATAGIQVISNASPVLAQSTITLTATVTSSNGIPTGVVTFLDGATSLGTGTLNANGVATLATSTLTAGSHTITAAYAGDANFTAATSSALTQVVEDFSLAISGGSAGITSVTTKAGGTAVFTFTLNPAGSTTFPSAIVLSASGLPAGATATFSPATLAAGTGTTTVTFTIQLAQAAANSQPWGPDAATREVVAQNSHAPRPVSKLPFLGLALLLLPFSAAMRRSGRKLNSLLPILLLLAAGIAATVGVSGCGGSSTSTTSAPVTYTVHVTGTSGTLSHSMDVTLTVD